MAKFKLVNIIKETVKVAETKKEAAEVVSKANVTENSLKTIEKKIGQAAESGEVLYETFKIEEIKEEELEMTKKEIVANTEVEEIVEDAKEEIKAEVIAEVEESSTEPWDEMTDEEKVEGILEGHTKKEAINLGLLDKDGKLPKEEKEEEKPSKRKVGKGIISYKDGEEYERFPSIKACAAHFKDLLGLGHMPFTPIMKSVREDIDWNEYSFKHENEEDLHIPESLKSKLSKEGAGEPTKEEKKEMKEEAKETEGKDEEIEEIIEEEIAN